MSDQQQEEALARAMNKSMRTKLASNRHKPYWRLPTTTIEYLFDRLLEEVEELRINPSWEEAADVANFAAMIADNCEPLDVGVNQHE